MRQALLINDFLIIGALLSYWLTDIEGFRTAAYIGILVQLVGWITVAITKER